MRHALVALQTTTLLATLACAIPPSASAQSAAAPADQPAAPAPTMTFDVASVRETHPVGPHRVMGPLNPHASRIDFENMSPMLLLTTAYDLTPDLVASLPDWARTATYDVHANGSADADAALAKLPEAQARAEKQHMLQALLADRFALKVHWEQRDAPVYSLTVAHGGIKFHESKPRDPNSDAPAKPEMNQGSNDDGLVYYANGLTMASFANWLTAALHRPVTDNTGLSGKYDFTIDYFMARKGGSADDASGKSPPLDVALPEQLGLKLETARSPVRTLVVDHIDRPTEN